jgi:hypothetical protein
MIIIFIASTMLPGLRICLFNGIAERSIDLFVAFLGTFASEFDRSAP